MIYKINTQEEALETLCKMTELSSEFFNNLLSEKSLCNKERLINEIRLAHGEIVNIGKIDCLFYHITTSRNACKNILESGLLNLEKTIKNENSDIQVFLKNNGVTINYDNQCLIYNGKYFSIEFEHEGECPPKHYKEAYNGWLVGRKLYWDKGVCGFFSMSESDPYGSPIQKCPEIIIDIDRLVKNKLAAKWKNNSTPYLISALVSANEIEMDDELNDEQIVEELLFKAFINSKEIIGTEELLCKTNVCIDPERILNVESFDYWD